MAADIFAKLGDIKGESLDSKHKDEVEVLSWSWGVNTSSSTGGAGSGKANFSDFNFIHHIDKASPNLLKACATGEHIKEATITARKAGKGQQEFLIIKMNDVIITSVAMSGSGDTAATAESVALRFGKVDLEYKPQKADGSLDAGLHFKYEIKANKVGSAPKLVSLLESRVRQPVSRIPSASRREQSGKTVRLRRASVRRTRGHGCSGREARADRQGRRPRLRRPQE